MHTVDVQKSSPFAASLLFGYVANYLYDGDAPLAERRAHALSVDQAQLAELIGEGELRDAGRSRGAGRARARRAAAAGASTTRDPPTPCTTCCCGWAICRWPRSRRASAPGVAAPAIDELVARRRALPVRIAGEARLIAVEDAARYRDGAGHAAPAGPAGVAAGAGARSRWPTWSAATRARTDRSRPATWPPGSASARRSWTATLQQLAREPAAWSKASSAPAGRAANGATPTCCARSARRSLAALRKEVEPVEPHVLGRFLIAWHGLVRPRARPRRAARRGGAAAGRAAGRLGARARGPAGAGRRLQAGAARHAGLGRRGHLAGRGAAGRARRPHRALPHRPPARCWPPPASTEGLSEIASAASWPRCTSSGASFFGPLHDAAGGGFPQETVDALWDLVWKGLVTNDTLHPLRAYHRQRRRARGARPAPIASARAAWCRRRPRAAGRRCRPTGRASATAWATALTQQLLTRHGVVARDVTTIEPVPGGFSTIYPVLRRLEDTGPGAARLLRGRPGRRAVRRARRRRSAPRRTRSRRRRPPS